MLNFKSISNGEYSQLLFDLFGKERVLRELETYFLHNMIPRYGGAFGVTRLARAMKQKGLFFDVMADADMITKLQPRFAAVWAFHGHNMAYNISVIHNTAAERWEWVMAGINLVRNKGLRYNPNDLQLHRELSFWFSHKIEGVADDAHFYYKKELCKEWHYLLGQPPVDHEDRIAWIKEVADAGISRSTYFWCKSPG